MSPLFPVAVPCGCSRNCCTIPIAPLRLVLPVLSSGTPAIGDSSEWNGSRDRLDRCTGWGSTQEMAGIKPILYARVGRGHSVQCFLHRRHAMLHERTIAVPHAQQEWVVGMTPGRPEGYLSDDIATMGVNGRGPGRVQAGQIVPKRRTSDLGWLEDDKRVRWMAPRFHLSSHDKGLSSALTVPSKVPGWIPQTLQVVVNLANHPSDRMKEPFMDHAVDRMVDSWHLERHEINHPFAEVRGPLKGDGMDSIDH